LFGRYLHSYTDGWRPFAVHAVLSRSQANKHNSLTRQLKTSFRITTEKTHHQHLISQTLHKAFTNDFYAVRIRTKENTVSG